MAKIISISILILLELTGVKSVVSCDDEDRKPEVCQLSAASVKPFNDVNVGIEVIDMIKVDEIHQTITMYLFILQSWKDETYAITISNSSYLKCA